MFWMLVSVVTRSSIGPAAGFGDVSVVPAPPPPLQATPSRLVAAAAPNAARRVPRCALSIVPLPRQRYEAGTGRGPALVSSLAGRPADTPRPSRPSVARDRCDPWST